MFSPILLIIAILTTGVVYGTDMFYALIVRKASLLSKESSIADLTGYTHLVADKRMPFFGITSIICTALFTLLNFKQGYLAALSGSVFMLLLVHLLLYIRIAKPVNVVLSAAAVQQQVPENTRTLQNRWDSIIACRAALMGLAMLLLAIALACTK